MVQIEEIGNATPIVTDPRVGPPSGVSCIESPALKSELSNWLLVAGVLGWEESFLLESAKYRHIAPPCRPSVP